MEHIIVPIIGFTVCGVIGYAIGRCLKVKRTDMAFIWGALLGPIGWIIVVFLEKDNGDGAAHTFSHNNWADTVVCISCNKRVPRAGVRRNGGMCPYCGAEILASPTPVRTASSSTANAFCPNCGEPVTPGSNFCGKCGHRLV